MADPEPRPDPGPASNPELFGHETAEARFAQALAENRMAHAWLITGPKGIGKATLAYRAARTLLAAGSHQTGLALAPGAGSAEDPVTNLAMPPEEPVFRRVAAGSHPDLVVLAPGVNPRTGKRREEIIVDDVRAVGRFLALTPGESRWRVAIIDSADELNRNASNALLKILEEPPERAALLVVSHAPGRLLATLRSRCRRLPLTALDKGTVIQVLERVRPDLDPASRDAVASLAQGSPGLAVRIADHDGLAAYRAILDRLAGLPALDVEALHGLADRLTRRGAEEALWVGLALLRDLIARVTRARAMQAEAEPLIPEEAAAIAAMAAIGDLEQWVALWENIGASGERAQGLNLDKKQVIIGAFGALESAARR